MARCMRSPARTAREFDRFMGHWLTEGVNSTQYFIHVGNIIWDDDIRERFESVLPIMNTVGSYHVPKAQCALLTNDRMIHLTGFPP